jgi:fructokinase
MKARNRTSQRARISRLSDPWSRLHKHPGRPVAVGTGFLALDIVIGEGREQHLRTWAGGTCGNVLAVLAYLGWRSYPVASLGKDVAAERVIADLTEHGVDVRFIRQDPMRRTPIVIERIRKLANGVPRSRFVWTCPGCGTWLPGYQAVVVKDMEPVVASMPDAKVLFFDRVSRGALELAAAAAKRGALVVFEPSGIGDERLFREALRMSHVVKYSHERLAGIGERLGEGAPVLEIETLGAEGLRYRLRGSSRKREWRLLDAFIVTDVKDTVGAGDWCTAGIIHALGAEGAQGLVKADKTTVEEALRLGQALAALACGYEGARGAMYAMDKRQFRASIKEILNGGSRSSRAEQPDAGLQELWKSVCPACDPERGERPRSQGKARVGTPPR